jgi:hypothetical protein
MWLVGIACSRISGILSGFCVTRADMESAHGAPIGTSGSLGAEGLPASVRDDAIV